MSFITIVTNWKPGVYDRPYDRGNVVLVTLRYMVGSDTSVISQYIDEWQLDVEKVLQKYCEDAEDKIASHTLDVQ